MANRLRQLRIEKGITSNELAKSLAITGSAVRSIERGDRDFSMESLKRACDYFHVSADYMLGWSGQERTTEGGKRYEK